MVDRDKQARDYLDNAIVSGKIPGIQYLVTDRSEANFEYNGGVLDVKTGAPVQLDSTLMLNSVTKTFTAAVSTQSRKLRPCL